jgi:hypothetical protein
MKTREYRNATSLRLLCYTKQKRSPCRLRLTVGEEENEANHTRGSRHVTFIRRLAISFTEFSGVGLKNVPALTENEVKRS